MGKVDLMNEAIVRRRAFFMERDKDDRIGMDPPTEIKDDGCEGYVMYAEDAYNFENEIDRRDMFMHMIEGIYYGSDKDPDSLHQFVLEATRCMKAFKDERVR